MIRSILGRAAFALAALSLAFAPPAMAANINVKDGAGSTQTMCAAVEADNSLAYCFKYHNAAGAQEDLATKAQMLLLVNAIGPVGSPTGTGLTIQFGAPQPVLAPNFAGTDASGTVTTANAYQVLQAANALRKGCLIQNTSTNTELVKQGTTIWTLLSGQTFSCAAGFGTVGDAISITSATASSQFSSIFE